MNLKSISQLQAMKGDDFSYYWGGRPLWMDLGDLGERQGGCAIGDPVRIRFDSVQSLVGRTGRLTDVDPDERIYPFSVHLDDCNEDHVVAWIEPVRVIEVPPLATTQDADAFLESIAEGHHDG